MPQVTVDARFASAGNIRGITIRTGTPRQRQAGSFKLLSVRGLAVVALASIAGCVAANYHNVVEDRNEAKIARVANDAAAVQRYLDTGASLGAAMDAVRDLKAMKELALVTTLILEAPDSDFKTEAMSVVLNK